MFCLGDNDVGLWTRKTDIVNVGAVKGRHRKNLWRKRLSFWKGTLSRKII